jgi:tRNA dimethylallyltransferase
MKGRRIEKQKVIVIQGPTGVGKTAVASELYEKLPIEIINADSLQFYRHMDIGTSKPTPEVQLRIPHHLFSIVNPDESFNAARFMETARQAVDDILLRGKIPVTVGGTGLYIKALIKGLSAAPEGDEDLRKELRRENKEELFKRLTHVDPESSQNIHPNDVVRIIRALEVFYLTGEPLSQHHLKHEFRDAPYSCLKICLARDRPSLYRRIDLRVDRMMERGLLQEVRSLIDMGYCPETKALQSIGYRQMVGFINGCFGLQEAVSQIKKETRHFAKRQLTWLRHDPENVWVRLPENAGKVEVLVKKFLNIL